MRFEARATLTAELTSNDGAPKVLHIYELSAYDSCDLVNTTAQASTTTPSVGVTTNTNHANEFILAAFLDQSHGVRDYHGGQRLHGGVELTNAELTLFTEYQEISSIGMPSASATVGNAGHGVVDDLDVFLQHWRREQRRRRWHSKRAYIFRCSD